MKKTKSKWLKWNEEKKKKKLTETLELTYNLFLKGHSIKKIARLREFKIQTVEYQIIELVTMSFLDVDDLVNIRKKEKILSKLDKKSLKSLKVLKEKLPENISYFEIKCVLASLNTQPDHPKN